MTGKSVNRFELPICVEVPQNFSVRCRVCAQMAIERAGKNSSGNRCHRRGLRRTARPPIFTTGRRGLPDTLTVIDAESKHSAAFVGIEFVLTIMASRLQSDIKSNVRQSDVEIAPIRRTTPFDSANRAAFADSGLPQYFTSTIGIDRVCHTGLLPQ